MFSILFLSMQVELIAQLLIQILSLENFGSLATLFPLMHHKSYFKFISSKLAKSIPVKIGEVRFC